MDDEIYFGEICTNEVQKYYSLSENALKFISSSENIEKQQEQLITDDIEEDIYFGEDVGDEEMIKYNLISSQCDVADCEIFLGEITEFEKCIYKKLLYNQLLHNNASKIQRIYRKYKKLRIKQQFLNNMNIIISSRVAFCTLQKELNQIFTRKKQAVKIIENIWLTQSVLKKQLNQSALIIQKCWAKFKQRQQFINSVLCFQAFIRSYSSVQLLQKLKTFAQKRAVRIISSQYLLRKSLKLKKYAPPKTKTKSFVKIKKENEPFTVYRDEKDKKIKWSLDIVNNDTNHTYNYNSERKPKKSILKNSIIKRSYLSKKLDTQTNKRFAPLRSRRKEIRKNSLLRGGAMRCVLKEIKNV